jgi:hypothetical protein
MYCSVYRYALLPRIGCGLERKRPGRSKYRSRTRIGNDRALVRLGIHPRLGDLPQEDVLGSGSGFHVKRWGCHQRPESNTAEFGPPVFGASSTAISHPGAGPMHLVSPDCSNGKNVALICAWWPPRAGRTPGHARYHRAYLGRWRQPAAGVGSAGGSWPRRRSGARSRASEPDGRRRAGRASGPGERADSRPRRAGSGVEWKGREG